MDKMIRFNEVAKQLGIHRETLRRWIARGKGPTLIKTPGGHHVFYEDDVRRWRDRLEKVEPTS